MQKINEKQIRERVAADLRAAFPETFNFSRKQFANIAGLTEGHISNLEVKKSPIVRPVREGRKILYPFPDVADYLAKQRLETIKRGAGRPTKAEQISARQAGGEA